MNGDYFLPWYSHSVLTLFQYWDGPGVTMDLLLPIVHPELWTELTVVLEPMCASERSSVPIEVGCTTVWAWGCVHQPGSSPKFILMDFYGGCNTQA